MYFVKLKEQISLWYLQYELVTCLYMFEPWERRFINFSIALILALFIYSSYTYLPHYMSSVFQR